MLSECWTNIECGMLSEWWMFLANIGWPRPTSIMNGYLIYWVNVEWMLSQYWVNVQWLMNECFLRVQAGRDRRAWWMLNEYIEWMLSDCWVIAEWLLRDRWMIKRWVDVESICNECWVNVEWMLSDWWKIVCGKRRLAKTKEHRLFVCDDKKHPLGIISVADICNLFAKLLALPLPSEAFSPSPAANSSPDSVGDSDVWITTHCCVGHDSVNVGHDSVNVVPNHALHHHWSWRVIQIRVTFGILQWLPAEML